MLGLKNFFANIHLRDLPNFFEKNFFVDFMATMMIMVFVACEISNRGIFIAKNLAKWAFDQYKGTVMRFKICLSTGRIHAWCFDG